LDLALGLDLEVAEVGDGAEVFVLFASCALIDHRWGGWKMWSKANLEVDDLGVLLLQLLAQLGDFFAAGLSISRSVPVGLLLLRFRRWGIRIPPQIRNLCWPRGKYSRDGGLRAGGMEESGGAHSALRCSY